MILRHFFKRLGALTLILAALSAGSGASAQSGGKILYTISTGTSNTVLVMDESTGFSSIVAEGAVYGADWSPDGGDILLVRRVEGLGQIVRARSDGSEPVQLTREGDHYNVRWSPAGGQIAFNRQLGGMTHLMLMDDDGGGARILADGDVTLHTWSPDGAYLVVSRESTPYLFDIATGAVSRLAFADDSSSVFSDWQNGGLVLTRYGQSGRQTLLASLDGASSGLAPAPYDASAYDAALSADGSGFIFVSALNSPLGDLYAGTVGSAAVTRLTFSGDSARLAAVAYWTPPVQEPASVILPRSLTFSAAAAAFDTEIRADATDPASVARALLEALNNGRLDEYESLVCPEMLDDYLALSQAVAARYSRVDVSGAGIAVQSHGTSGAAVTLSGNFSVFENSGWRDVPAALFPSLENPITLLYLSSANGWQICTPL